MAAQLELVEDPLIAALPPATDYITYLTLLEYQLNSKNLPTLNRLLSEDDGTLASEIGWDLLKLVLPMLQVIPEDANKCFEIIGRRGNPREVIVRVAEELERLGQNDDSEEESEFEQDELPTFAGEATRIHLGEMKLEGMPEESTTWQEKLETPEEDVDHSRPHHAESGSDDALSFKALVRMLGILHPRIKTQHPSRFLATSLPAALGAYRRLPITEETTLVFVNLLGQLSGKQRPALPPRVSTSGSQASLLIGSGSSAQAGSAPLLPDPESHTETHVLDPVAVDQEKAIIRKLLQAVLLEIVDEHSNSLLAHDVISMQWTSRLREQIETSKVVPGRPSIEQQWAKDAELSSRDGLEARFLDLARDLSLDVKSGLIELTDSKQTAAASGERAGEGNETDYPQSPSDIPFPASGLVILQSAKQFYRPSRAEALPLSVAIDMLNNSDSIGTSQSTALTDALLSLVYRPLLQVVQSRAEPEVKEEGIAKSIRELSSIFTSHPDSLTRDNAHHIAALIFHNLASIDTKISCVKSLLRTRGASDNSLTSIQSGNLKAIAVKWLKDEFLACTSSTNKSTPSSASESNHATLDPGILTENADELINLIFPNLPSLPGPFISSHPPAATNTNAGEEAPKMSTEEDLETFLLQMPYFIASLNLITILSSISIHHHNNNSSSSSGGNTHTETEHQNEHENENEHDSVLTTTPNLLSKVTTFTQTLRTWHDGLAGLLAAATKNTKQQSHSQHLSTTGNEPVTSIPGSTADLYALEDALRRTDAVLARSQQT